MLKLYTILLCEGDLSLIDCATETDLRSEVAKINDWNAEQGYRAFSNGKSLGIDPGFNAELKQACMVAGLAEYLH